MNPVNFIHFGAPFLGFFARAFLNMLHIKFSDFFLEFFFLDFFVESVSFLDAYF